MNTSNELEFGDRGVSRTLVVGPSNSRKCGETPFLKSFPTFLDKSQGSCFKNVEVQTSIPPLGTPLFGYVQSSNYNDPLFIRTPE